MFLTKASEYAFLGLMSLRGCEHPKDIETMSSQLKISKSFLAKILQTLARAGVLRSYKGIHGGFCLARPPEAISVKEVVDAVETKKTTLFVCEGKTRKMCGVYRKLGCNICEVFEILQEKFDIFLENVTLADIMSYDPKGSEDGVHVSETIVKKLTDALGEDFEGEITDTLREMIAKQRRERAAAGVRGGGGGNFSVRGGNFGGGNFNPNFSQNFGGQNGGNFNPNHNPNFNPNHNPNFNQNGWQNQGGGNFNSNHNPNFNPNFHPNFNPNHNPNFNQNGWQNQGGGGNFGNIYGENFGKIGRGGYPNPQNPQNPQNPPQNFNQNYNNQPQNFNPYAAQNQQNFSQNPAQNGSKNGANPENNGGDVGNNDNGGENANNKGHE